MFIWALLEWLTKQTTGTDVDDRFVNDLQSFFRSNPKIRSSVMSVAMKGWNNKFDVHDEEWTGDVLEVVFDIIRAKSDSAVNDLGSNKL